MWWSSVGLHNVWCTKTNGYLLWHCTQNIQGFFPLIGSRWLDKTSLEGILSSKLNFSVLHSGSLPGDSHTPCLQTHLNAFQTQAPAVKLVFSLLSLIQMFHSIGEYTPFSSNSLAEKKILLILSQIAIGEIAVGQRPGAHPAASLCFLG